MRNIFILLFIVFLSFWSVSANLEDTSIIDELEKQEIKTLDFDFNLKSFESCEWLDNVMWKYIKDYWVNNKEKFRPYPVMYKTIWINQVDMVMEDSVVRWAVVEKAKSIESLWSDWGYSKTNSQVDWVDESDIVKTDWKYIYY